MLFSSVISSGKNNINDDEATLLSINFFLKKYSFYDFLCDVNDNHIIKNSELCIFTPEWVQLSKLTFMTYALNLLDLLPNKHLYQQQKQKPITPWQLLQNS